MFFLKCDNMKPTTFMDFKIITKMLRVEITVGVWP